MTFLHSAIGVFQSILGIAPRKVVPYGGTDWLKLALSVAAQPENDESRQTVRAALQNNNQEFLDYLRSALDTRSAAAARVAEINQDGIECRAFLPGSPALWGWTTNMAAEASVLQEGIEAAMESSVLDSSPTAHSTTGEDVLLSTRSSETMGGATLRDTYAKAWELHREPLVWTPRVPTCGSGESTWVLTPMSLVMPSAQARARRASDASDGRTSIVGLSPSLYAQQNQVRRDSLHDVFTNPDMKQKGLASPFVESAMITPSPSLNATTPPLAYDSSPSLRRRPASCTRSHVSCTTAVTASECSTTQELTGLGLGLSLGESTFSRPSTPSDLSFGDNEVGEGIPRGRRLSYHLLGRHVRVPSGTLSRNNQTSRTPMENKQCKSRRPGATPLQRVEASVSKRSNLVHDLAHTVSASRPFRDGSSQARGPPINRIVSGAYSKATLNSRDKITSLRRAQSVATMALSPSPQLPRIVAPRVPLLGPVPATRRVMSKHSTSPSRDRPNGQTTQVSTSRRSSYQAPRLVSTPTPQQPNHDRPRTPSLGQPRITRPASRVSLRPARATEFAQPRPQPEPRQLQTPSSTVRERSSISQFPRSTIPGTSGRTRSRAGSSAQDPPKLTKDVRLSRPSSRAQIAPARRSTRSDSVASASTMAEWRTRAEESFTTPVFA